MEEMQELGAGSGTGTGNGTGTGSNGGQQPFAVNRFTVTKDLFYEGMKRTSKESYGPAARKSVVGLIVLWLILAVVTGFMNGALHYVVIEFIVIVLMCLWVTMYLPWMKTRRAWKAMENKYGTEMDREVRFYEQFLEVSASCDEVTVFYEDVREVLESKHLLILVSQDKTGIMVALDGFVSGGLDEVRSHVQKYQPGKS